MHADCKDGTQAGRLRRAFRRLPKAVLVLASVAVNWTHAQEATVSVVPDADALVSSQAPTNNYGGAGALTVSGSAAVNETGQQNGLYDTLMRFPASDLVAVFDGALGGDDWVVTGARLVLTEMAAPDNEIFNQGVGEFEIRWIAEDGWTEGTGKPMLLTTDGVAWQDVPSILNSNLDVSVGIFTNSGADATVPFDLALAERLVADVRAGGEIGLYLTARSPEIGFTFNSRSVGKIDAHPKLTLTARTNPRPRIESIQLSGTNVMLSFEAVSNWTYTVQWADSPMPQSGGWSNTVTLPVQGATSRCVYLEAATGQQRFYRLRVAP